MGEYACVDGVYFKEEQVVKMAQNAGSFAVAEHYLCALLAHGLMYGKNGDHRPCERGEGAVPGIALQET